MAKGYGFIDCVKSGAEEKFAIAPGFDIHVLSGLEASILWKKKSFILRFEDEFLQRPRSWPLAYLIPKSM